MSRGQIFNKNNNLVKYKMLNLFSNIVLVSIKLNSRLTLSLIGRKK